MKEKRDSLYGKNEKDRKGAAIRDEQIGWQITGGETLFNAGQRRKGKRVSPTKRPSYLEGLEEKEGKPLLFSGVLEEKHFCDKELQKGKKLHSTKRKKNVTPANGGQKKAGEGKKSSQKGDPRCTSTYFPIGKEAAKKRSRRKTLSRKKSFALRRRRAAIIPRGGPLLLKKENILSDENEAPPWEGKEEVMGGSIRKTGKRKAITLSS